MPRWRGACDVTRAGLDWDAVTVQRDEARALAEVVHDLWRRRMAEAGWRYGPVYDRAQRIHDCLAPFSQIAPEDQDAAIDTLLANEIPDDLVARIDYDRSAERPFRAAEMRTGLPVAWATGVRPAEELEGSSRGEVAAWQLDAVSGRLVRFTVTWDTGAESEHTPMEPDLRRVDEH